MFALDVAWFSRKPILGARGKMPINPLLKIADFLD